MRPIRFNNIRARGVRRKPGEMNKLEAAYAEHLEGQVRTGEVVWFKFDAIKFRLAASTFYTPDFLIMLADGTMEVHEVKGFWEDDARVKIKVAADIYPFAFKAITRKKSDWIIEQF